jgi:hypothetical protein
VEVRYSRLGDSTQAQPSGCSVLRDRGIWCAQGVVFASRELLLVA